MGKQVFSCQTAVELCERNLNGPWLQNWHDLDKMIHDSRGESNAETQSEMQESETKNAYLWK